MELLIGNSTAMKALREQTDRLPVVRDDYVLSVIIALTVVVSIKVVGIVLIAAFLVIPAASSRLLSRTFRMMTVFSVLIGVVSAFVGLLLRLGLQADIFAGESDSLLFNRMSTSNYSLFRSKMQYYPHGLSSDELPYYSIRRSMIIEKK